jgi:hypothetical protein
MRGCPGDPPARRERSEWRAGVGRVRKRETPLSRDRTRCAERVSR